MEVFKCTKLNAFCSTPLETRYFLKIYYILSTIHIYTVCEHSTIQDNAKSLFVKKAAT